MSLRSTVFVFSLSSPFTQCVEKSANAGKICRRMVTFPQSILFMAVL
jgi:hypothetical protein